MTDLRMILNDGGFTFFLENVKGSKLKSALKSGLRKSLNIIKRKATSNLKAITFKNGKKLDVNKEVDFKNSYGTHYYAAPFKKGIVTKLKRDGSSGRVQIMTKDTDKNWNPILKMIEASKGERKTSGNSHQGIKKGRKAHSTGSIAHTFFTSAVNSTKQQVQTSLQKNLEDAIMRARDKFYK
jgi:hypothetical protein